MEKDPVCGMVVDDKTSTISTRYNLNSIFDK
jgi:YHS domain-containing protein